MSHTSQSISNLTQFALHLFALLGFALAQPLFNLLGNYPEFFIARGSEPVDIFLLAVVPSLFIPLVCLGLVAVMWACGPIVQHYLKILLVSLFSSLLSLQILKKITIAPGELLVCTAVVAGILTAYAYNRFKLIHTYLAFLSPVAFLFPALFILSPGIARVAFPDSEISSSELATIGVSSASAESSSVPVVMVVLDEFPLTTLLDDEMQIDGTRFPNISNLADQANWYRNATTVSDSTLVSIPSLLSGISPVLNRKRLPTLADYPKNLFTLLADTHELNIIENGTKLSPLPNEETLNPFSLRIRALIADLSIVYGHILLPWDLADLLPAIDQSWNSFKVVKISNLQYDEFGDFSHQLEGAADIFDEFLAKISPQDPPSLYYLHAMLPHKPWQYLPEGQRYMLPPDVIEGGVRLNNNYGTFPAWGDDQALIDYAYRRHALQAGYADKRVGDLIHRLKEANLFDRALVIITSDHGTSFRPNVFQRRASYENLGDIMWVPLIIKLPFQQQGMVSDRNVESIDILPTVIDTLDMQVDWELGGQSVLRTTLAERPIKNLLAGTNQAFELNAQSDLREKSLMNKLRAIRSGAWESMYGVPEYDFLIGKPITDYERGESSLDIEIVGASLFTSISPDSEFILTDIKGSVSGTMKSEEPGYLAIGVNGFIRSVVQLGQRFKLERKFATLVPESALTAGRNEVSAYFIRDGTGKVSLLRLQGGTPPQYSLVLGSENAADSLFLPAGQQIPIDGQDVRGYVRSDLTPDGKFISISGWSVDVTNAASPEVLVFVNGQFRASIAPDILREDVEAEIAEAAGLTPGFSTILPITQFRALDEEQVRVLGISDSSATELNVETNWIFAN